MESNLEKNNTLIWESSIPIFKNPFILPQLGMTFWLPIVVLFVAVSFLTNFAPEVVIVMSGILILSAGGMLVVFGLYNFNYKVLTTVDDKGIYLRPALLDTPKWKIVRGVSTFLGIFSRRPGIAGAAILSGSGSGENMMWEEIHDFAPQPAHLAYVVKLNGSRKTVVFCNAANFEEIGMRYTTILEKIRAEYVISKAPAEIPEMTKETEVPTHKEV